MSKILLVDRIGFLYLKLFSIMLIMLLSVALIGSVIFLGKALMEWNVNAEPIQPAREGDPFKVTTDKFLRQLTSQEEATTKKELPQSQPTNPGELMVDEYVKKLWMHFDGYQKACNVKTPTDEKTFVEVFPKSVLRVWFGRYGRPFAESQDSFVSAVLKDKDVVRSCIESSGKRRVFTSALEWHHNEWTRLAKVKEEFEEAENRRVREQQISEEQRINRSRGVATLSLTVAGWLFAVFMSLALLLIFSRIEQHLRRASPPMA